MLAGTPTTITRRVPNDRSSPSVPKTHHLLSLPEGSRAPAAPATRLIGRLGWAETRIRPPGGLGASHRTTPRATDPMTRIPSRASASATGWAVVASTLLTPLAGATSAGREKRDADLLPRRIADPPAPLPDLPSPGRDLPAHGGADLTARPQRRWTVGAGDRQGGRRAHDAALGRLLGSPEESSRTSAPSSTPDPAK